MGSAIIATGQILAGSKAHHHAQYRGYGLELRALGTLTHLDDTKELSTEAGETIAKVLLGYYGEVAYDVLPLALPQTLQLAPPSALAPTPPALWDWSLPWARSARAVRCMKSW